MTISLSLSSSSSSSSSSSPGIPLKNTTVYTSIISNFIGVSLDSSTTSSTMSSIQSMYKSYVDAIGSIVIASSSTSGRTNATVVSNANLQIVITTMLPVNSISSLSSRPSHQIVVDATGSSSGSRRLASNQIPMVMSVTRATLYYTSDPNIRSTAASINTNITTNSTSTNTTNTNNASNATTPALSNVPYYRLVSNPLRIQLDCSQMYTNTSTTTSSKSRTIRIVLHNFDSPSFESIVPITTSFTTTCTTNNATTTIYTCRYHDGSSYRISVPCDGTRNTTYVTQVLLSTLTLSSSSSPSHHHHHTTTTTTTTTTVSCTSTATFVSCPIQSRVMSAGRVYY